MTNSVARLEELLDDHQHHHSTFQMDHFITTRSGGTPYGMLKQALRELSSRKRALRELYASRATQRIELAKRTMALADLDKNIEDTEREFNRFFQQADKLKKQVGELTPEKRTQLDQEMWEHQIRATAACEVVATGRVGKNTAELVLSLPREMRRQLACELFDGGQAKLTKWFTEYEPPGLELDELGSDSTNGCGRLLEAVRSEALAESSNGNDLLHG
jgi:hypothetical protein